MAIKYSKEISSKLSIAESKVEPTIKLLEEDNTIPFISRYRKEVTGNLDESQVLDIQKELTRLKEIDSRRQTILKEIKKQGRLTDELKRKILNTASLTELEDIYLPYKPKRKTKATIAKNLGLEPLAKTIFSQKDINLKKEAKKYLTDKVKNNSDALEGARNIISEWVAEDKKARDAVRRLFEKEAVICSRVIKGKEEQGSKFKDYFDYREPLSRISSHRLLALRRGEKEKILRVLIKPDDQKAIEALNKLYVSANNPSAEQVEMAVEDGYKRLLWPSIETEFANISKEKADQEAIEVFAKNLRQLLLAPMLGRKKVLAIDPGFRTGCKVVCLNQQGDLVDNINIYPNEPQKKVKEAGEAIKSLVRKYGIEVIAIGDGTAGRETRAFIRSLDLGKGVAVHMVSEAGASIYSASKIAREEFPEYDVTVRGAVSIGRRLMDPLAELVKIDPKSIGVGQYQHDVDQNKLKESLNQVVESCVNLVGVNLNTASKYLLTYVSGLGPKLGENIIEFRAENGPFSSREELKEVPRMGDKVFQQCAGFLRIQDGSNPLDSSGVHPESYYIVERIARDLGASIKELMGTNIEDRISLNNYTDRKTGLPTLRDIAAELLKPGRDPRETVDSFEFKKDVTAMDDLRVGMVLPGIVTNVTNFGAFVNIGLKSDGLIHISELSHKFVDDPSDVVKMHQHLNVKVIDIDKDRNRISLSLRI